MANNNQGRRDHSDRLLCPTDPELITYCLRPKIERGTQNPNYRFGSEVHIYDDSPDELTEKYVPCENKWYFLTKKARKRDTNENLGTWKATAKDTMVCDDATQQVLGMKRCLAYFDANKLKTPWLMHEYTMNDPKIVTIGSRDHYKDNNKMADWVLCKIYKEKNPINVNDNVEYEVQNI